MRHGATSPDSPVGNLAQCAYETGNCVLQDGSILLWTPNEKETCRFTPVMKMRGRQIGEIWISDSKEFALSWRDSSDRVQDCGSHLILTDQGYAVALVTRLPRSSSVDAGIVTSNQLAAQLLAVEGSVGSAVSALFHHALSALCDRTNLLAFALHTSLAASPTLTLRNLLGRADIAATSLGSDLVQIHRCMAIPPHHFELIPFNGTCYSKPLVKIIPPSGSAIFSFLDPATLVVSQQASPTECSTVRYFYLSHNTSYLKFDSSTGETQVLPYSGIRNIGPYSSINASTLALPLTIFHNLILTNLSELVQDHQWQELWSAASTDHFAHVRVPEEHALPGSLGLSSFSLWTLVFGSWSFFDLWIAFCCVIVSIRTLKAAVVLYCNLFHPEWLPRFQEQFFEPSVLSFRAISRPPLRPSISPPVIVTEPTPTPVELACVKIDATSSWPPRAIMSPVNVLYLSDQDRYFVAQIPIRVNNISVLALIDTGASITITSVDAVPLFGAFNLSKSDVTSAVGMAGVPVHLMGYALLSFEIGTLTFNHPVYFTRSACIPDVADTYNIILGNDLLRKLPPWSIDYGTRTLRMADQQLKILCAVPNEPPPSPDQLVAVRAAETTVLPPAAETFVRCRTDETESGSLMLVTQSEHLSEKSLMVTPAVVNSPNPVLLVANPSNRPETLYKGQHLSSAVPLLEGESTLFSTSSLDTSPFVGSFSLRADRPETETQVIPSVVDLSYAEVSDEEREQLAQLFYEFRDRISTGSYDLGSYEDSEIVIKTTTETPPTRFRPPRIPIKFQKELDDHINKLLRAGRIVESDTPWVHNTVLVKKKDGSLRVCLDFRPLNEVTVPDHYPLPRIEDILAKIAGHRFYTTLDLASGYMQLLLSPESQEKCGWATHRGIYQFVYLPFGLKNAGAYFSRAMSRILAGLEANCLAYLDDIVIFDRDFPSHLQSLRKVFYRFRLYNIKASGKKLTEIARSHINFLGHEISGSSYSPAERNIRAIQEFPTPTTTKAVKGFVGMANFFRKFIANFALIASPLYALLKDKAKFVWGPEQEEAFQRLKLLLASKPCLAFPQDKEFFLHTDGSQHAVGAALFQNSSDTDRQLVAVGYFSKALSESQQKWSPTHIELFAIISALRFFRTTIYGNHTTIFSDHRPLTFLLKHNKTHDNLTRWVVELQSYDVTIEYLKGSSNVVADALSRAVNPRVRFEDDTPETDDIVEFPVSINKASPAIYSVRPTVCCLGPLHAIRPYDALQEQKRDRFCSALFCLIETQRFPPEISEEDKTTWLPVAEKCVIRKNGCLYYNDRPTATNPFRFERLVVPENLKEPIFLAFHTSPSSGGHFNWRKTLAKISRKYFWPHMAEDIFSLVRACDSCQRKRSNMANQEALIPVVSGAIFDKVYVDLTGPLHTSEAGNKYILAMIDHFSKYVIAAPLPDCTAVTVAQAIVSECILKYGVMTQLISDNASYFKGEVMTEIGRFLRIHRYFCTPYHHEGNGACERIFATFHPMLRTYINTNQLDWDQYITENLHLTGWSETKNMFFSFLSFTD
ncbi:integrase core domain protein [Teladorsagia circumcincta]|uniref:RNA-directed DNA polymerase n=1 Tax=Teladorsagia circumcincta TaxID=45464 RepID=A0A2G9TMZ9_TELCI|nr:integrase core domain protein [Teladorsagia circumcincta]